MSKLTPKQEAFARLVATGKSYAEAYREAYASKGKYLNNWLAALKDDKKLIVKAARLAQQAVDHIESYQSSNEQEAA